MVSAKDTFCLYQAPDKKRRILRFRQLRKLAIREANFRGHRFRSTQLWRVSPEGSYAETCLYGCGCDLHIVLKPLYRHGERPIHGSALDKLCAAVEKLGPRARRKRRSMRIVGALAPVDAALYLAARRAAVRFGAELGHAIPLHGGAWRPLPGSHGRRHLLAARCPYCGLRATIDTGRPAIGQMVGGAALARRCMESKGAPEGAPDAGERF